MNPASRNVVYSCFAIWGLLSCAKTTCAQKLTPGLPGMAPSKWITIRNTQAPGRIYQVNGSGAQVYNQEDIFFKAWIPLVMGNRFNLVLGPQYRTEQLELRGDGENPLTSLSHWNLRSMGADLRGCYRVDSMAWIVANLNVNQSGNLQDHSHKGVPVNYTFSTLFIQRKSADKEIGFGVMVNHSFGKTLAFPVVTYNYNYSTRGGFEVSLPYKISWRNNLSPTDLLYVKTEAMTRSYWINDGATSYAFRRTEVDMGVAYNKQFNRLVGVELFGGYRKNLSTRLPGEVTGVRTSGMVFSIELYFKSPLSK